MRVPWRLRPALRRWCGRTQQTGLAHAHRQGLGQAWRGGWRRGEGVSEGVKGW